MYELLKLGSTLYFFAGLLHVGFVNHLSGKQLFTRFSTCGNVINVQTPFPFEAVCGIWWRSVSAFIKWQPGSFKTSHQTSLYIIGTFLIFREWGRIRQPVHTFGPSKLSCLYFNRNINGDVCCQSGSANWPMVTPWHKWFRQDHTHMTTYLRLENKLKDHTPFLKFHAIKTDFYDEWQTFLFSSPEPKAHWWAYRIGRPTLYVCHPHSLNIFSSETTGPMKVKFHMELL